jgi:hypothetical protein
MNEFSRIADGFSRVAGRLTLNPTAGERLEVCIKEALVQAKAVNEIVTIVNFNGVDIDITPTTTEQQALEYFHNTLEQRHQLWLNSPEGREAVAKREQEIKHYQNEVDRLISRLPIIARNLDTLIDWLVEFSHVADDIGVRYNHHDVAHVLKTFGYQENAHCTEDKEEVKGWDRKTMGEYIVGQAINCLLRGLPPHPNLTPKFAEEYNATT